MKKVFITDYILNADIEKEIIGKHAEVICLDSPNEKDLPEIISEADGILVWHTEINKSAIEKLKNCKSIIRYGVGYDNIDVKYLTSKKINFANTPDYGTEEVADTASAFILNFIRKINFYDNFLKKNNKWQEEVINLNKFNPIKRTSDHKLGIIGLGRIGSALALRMKGFKMNVGFYDPEAQTGVEKIFGIKRYDSLEELAFECNIISINATLNDSSKGMIDKKFIDQIKKGTVIVNTARGAIIKNLDALLYGLKKGKLEGVGLDVLPDEPPEYNHEFFKTWLDKKNPLSDKILINPHAGYFSSSSIIEMREKAAKNMLLSLLGKKIKNIIK